MLQSDNRNSNSIGIVFLCLIFVSVTFGFNILSFSLANYQMTAYRLLSIIVFLGYVISSRKIQILKINDIVFNFIPILFAYAIIELLWCKDFNSWFHDFFFIMMALVSLYFLNGMVKDESVILRLIKCLGISIIIQAIFGTYEYITGNYMFLNNTLRLFNYTRYGTNYPVAMMDNVNNFGILMVLGVCFEHVLFSLSKSKIQKSFHLVLMAWYSWLTYASTSRGALLALGIVYVCILLCFKQNLTRKILFLLVGFIVLVTSYVYISDLLDLGGINFKSDIRILLAINGLHFLVESFFLGIGPGQGGWWFANRSIVDCGSITIFHNLWVEMLATFGIIAFVFYIIVYSKLVKRFHIIANDSNVASKERQYIAQGFFLFLVCFIVGSITTSSLLTQEWFWLVWALMITFYEITKPSTVYDLRE